MEAGDLGYEDLSQILRVVADTLDHRTAQQNGHTLEHRRLATVQRLLAGETVDSSVLNYNLTGSHAGFVISCHKANHSFGDVRRKLKSRLLLVRPDSTSIWGWLGGERPEVLRNDLHLLLAQQWPEAAAVACGEPAEAIAGWCLTHRQALAALPIAQSGNSPGLHYCDVALLATALRDDLLSSSLRRAYLEPLEAERDGGVAAKDTLRAYFKAERNVSSAAALLGVDRATVRSRLIRIEERLGRSPDVFSAPLEVALELEALGRMENA